MWPPEAASSARAARSSRRWIRTIRSRPSHSQPRCPRSPNRATCTSSSWPTRRKSVWNATSPESRHCAAGDVLMCGRYAYRASDFDYPGLFGTRPGEELADRYNIAPTQPVPVVRVAEDGSREVTVVRWGLVPGWVKDPAALKISLFNARAEGVAEKPSFRAAFRSRRCLVPVSGFYEWQKVDGAKQPWFIARTDGRPAFFAGLWETWGPA